MFASFRKRLLNEHELPFVDENLVDIGGQLNVATLLCAYRAGSFPWTVHPVTWWSPDPRAIIEFDSFHPSRSLLKAIRQGVFRSTVDQAFDRVIESCAAQTARRKTTWITPEFIGAYKDLHRAGYGHSVEMLAGPATGRRDLRSRHRRLFRRGIDVSPRQRRLESSALFSGATSARARLRALRHANAHSHHPANGRVADCAE